MDKPKKRRRVPRDVQVPDSSRKHVPWRDLPKISRPHGQAGRPTHLNEVTLAQIKTVCDSCAAPSDAYIARVVGVNLMVFKRWLSEYIGLREMVDEWKAAGIRPLREKAVRDAHSEGGKMLQWILERRDPDFRRVPVGDNAGNDDDAGDGLEVDLPPTEFL